jgi:hypothetical protein
MDGHQQGRPARSSAFHGLNTLTTLPRIPHLETQPCYRAESAHIGRFLL